MPRRRSKWETFGRIAGGAGQAMLQYWLAQQERKQERDMLDARLQSLLDLEDRKSANQLLLAQQDPKLRMQENLFRTLFPEIYGGGGRPSEGTPEEVIARLDNPGLAALQAQDPIMGISLTAPSDEESLFRVLGESGYSTPWGPLASPYAERSFEALRERRGTEEPPPPLVPVSEYDDAPALAIDDTDVIFEPLREPLAAPPPLDLSPAVGAPESRPPAAVRQPDDGRPSQFHPACERWQVAKIAAQASGIELPDSPPGIDCSAQTPEYEQWHNTNVVLPQVRAEAEARAQEDLVREVVETPEGVEFVTLTRKGDLVSQAPDSTAPPSLPGEAPPLGESSPPGGLRIGETQQKRERQDDAQALQVEMAPLKNFIKDLRALVPKLWKQGRTPEQRGIDCLKFNFTRSAPMLTDYVTGMWPGGDEGLDPDVMEFIRVREGWAGELAKLGGDTGRLSNQDIERAQNLLPRCNSTFEDANKAIDTMERAIDIKINAALAGINKLDPFHEASVTQERHIHPDSDPIESQTLPPIGKDGYPRAARAMATGAGLTTPEGNTVKRRR